MYYRHNLDIKYPERSDEHMITVKHLRDINVDENYPFVEKGFWAKTKRFLLSVGLHIFGYLLTPIRYGLKIHNRKILKKHKELLKDGAITICNHVLMWDYLCILTAIRPKLQYHAAWATNLEGPNGPFIRLVGGVPIPTNNIRAVAKWQQAMDEVIKDKKWIHFFPEGSMWFYYPDVRPFKPGVFKFAVKHNKPVIPMGISFRPRKGIWKLFGKKPFADLWIGEPILPDISLSRNEAIDKLHKEAYHAVQVLVGINPGDPTYNTDQNIDNYIKTM